MKLTIESTDVITTVDGQPARLWKGTTSGGQEVHVFVARVAVPIAGDQAAFERELRETGAPAELRAIPLRNIL